MKTEVETVHLEIQLLNKKLETNIYIPMYSSAYFD